MPTLPTPAIHTDETGTSRCWWCGDDDLYRRYHDEEWGFPVNDDHRLFEKICLEGFQAGLSWLTILRKRANFRDAFAGFDFHQVARFNTRSVDRLLRNEGIIRHRGKIEATINNARRAIELVEEFGSLAAFFWQFEDQTGIIGETMAASTEASKTLSSSLRERGWKFVGPTTAYAFMQAMGLVNDHVIGCHVRDRIDIAKRGFVKPVREVGEGA